jgi:hypothetical protein
MIFSNLPVNLLQGRTIILARMRTIVIHNQIPHAVVLCITDVVDGHERFSPVCRQNRNDETYDYSFVFLSDAQMVCLEKRFERQKYLSTSDRIELADMLRLSQLQIKTWYQNRRMKWKKQVREHV